VHSLQTQDVRAYRKHRQ